MIDNKLIQVEKAIKEMKEVQNKVIDMLNERKVKFSMIGINEVVRNLAEIMILEKFQDSINELIIMDEEEICILDLQGLQSEIPGAKEMLDYISLSYRDTLSDECQVIKSFIDSIKNHDIQEKLF